MGKFGVLCKDCELKDICKYTDNVKSAEECITNIAEQSNDTGILSPVTICVTCDKKQEQCSNGFNKEGLWAKYNIVQPTPPTPYYPHGK